MRIPALKECVI